MERARLRKHLRAVKDYFLLARGDLFQAFIDNTRGLLALPPSGLSVSVGLFCLMSSSLGLTTMSLSRERLFARLPSGLAGVAVLYASWVIAFAILILGNCVQGRGAVKRDLL